jgi:hypothetical protein
MKHVGGTSHPSSDYMMKITQMQFKTMCESMAGAKLDRKLVLSLKWKSKLVLKKMWLLR